MKSSNSQIFTYLRKWVILLVYQSCLLLTVQNATILIILSILIKLIYIQKKHINNTKKTTPLEKHTLIKLKQICKKKK